MQVGNVQRLAGVTYVVRQNPSRTKESTRIPVFREIGHFVKDLPDPKWEEPAVLWFNVVILQEVLYRIIKDIPFIGVNESGVLAQVASSFATARHRRALIVGDAGCIETTFLNDTSGTLPPLLQLQRGTGWELPEETIRTAGVNGFLAEGDAFHDLVRNGWESWTGATPQESVDIMLALDALAESARRGVPVEITG